MSVRQSRAFYLRPVACLVLSLLLAACAEVRPVPSEARAHLPVLRGWADGREVFYVTTDVSDASVAAAKGANFAPRLANSLPADSRAPNRRASTDKVYALTNVDHPSVFASAPAPIGAANAAVAYSPLWQLVKVTWKQPALSQVLRSEEEILAAAEGGRVTLEVTGVVLNCPIIQVGAVDGLRGVSIDAVSSRSAR